jgi:hypothetical protein
MSVVTMKKVVIDELSQIRDVAEIQDEQGNFVGTFTPATSRGPDAHTAFDFDDVEFERRRQSTHPGYTIEQVREHLRSKERSA